MSAMDCFGGEDFSVGSCGKYCNWAHCRSKSKQKCSLSHFPWFEIFHWPCSWCEKINQWWLGWKKFLRLSLKLSLWELSHFSRVSERVLSSSLYMFTFLFSNERKTKTKTNKKWKAIKASLHIRLGNVKLLDF